MPAKNKSIQSTPSATTLHNHLLLNWVALEELKAFGRKTRSHTRDQIRKLADSIATFGFSVPILVDDENRILAGHARLEAARLAGLDKAPVVVLSHLSAEQKRAFVIAENRLAELSGWDRDALRIELEELSELDLSFDLAAIGFDDVQIDAIVFGGETPAEPSQAELPSAGTTVSALGDLWLLGDHRLYCGDALAPEALERLLQGEEVRTVFTDPPYNVPIIGHVTDNAAHGEFVMASGEMTDEQFTAFLRGVWSQAGNALAPGGLVYLCMDWRHMHNVLAAYDRGVFDLMNLIVWDKTAAGMGSFYRSRHELIFLLKKKGAQHTNRVELGRHGRDRTNVWAYEGVAGAGHHKRKTRELHPTVKPLALVRDALLDCTATGDVVLDLFSGSGTTLLAAHEVRRRGRAIELDPRYVDVGVIRWQDFAGGEARLQATGETFAEVRARRSAEKAGA